MATNFCTLAGFQTEQGCFECLSETELEEIKLWLLIQWYTALGGTIDWDSAIQGAACLSCESEKALKVYELLSIRAAASASGAVDSDRNDVGTLTASELRTLVKCYPCADQKFIRTAAKTALCNILATLTA